MTASGINSWYDYGGDPGPTFEGVVSSAVAGGVTGGVLHGAGLALGKAATTIGRTLAGGAQGSLRNTAFRYYASSGLAGRVAPRGVLAARGGFGINGQIGSLPKGADSAVLRRLYLDQVKSTAFGVKLGIHNTIKKITTFGRSKWVTRIDIESVLRNKTQFRVGASTIHRLDDGFVIGGRESLGYFNRATSHHEMMHIGQYIRNPNIIDTRPIGYIHEVIPSYVGTPELYGSGTIVIGGAVYIINDALSD